MQDEEAFATVVFLIDRRGFRLIRHGDNAVKFCFIWGERNGVGVINDTRIRPPHEIRQTAPQSLKLRGYMYYEQARFPGPEIGRTSKMREVEIFTVA
jgi:hypothetical protein